MPWFTMKSAGGEEAKPKEEISFGANLPIGTKALASKVKDVSDRLTQSHKKYRSEIEKYKQIAEFNKKLSSSYLANLDAMLDVSTLLNEYTEFFDKLVDALNQSDATIDELSLKDIAYLRDLTKDKLDDFSTKFTKETKKAIDLFTQFEEPVKAKHVERAQESLASTITNAGVVLEKVTNANKQQNANKTSNSTKSQSGGRKASARKRVVAKNGSSSLKSFKDTSRKIR